jgi:SAM-dependent methyltransferase
MVTGYATDGVLINEEARNSLLNKYAPNAKDCLNIGCGPDYLEGWTNLDGDQRFKADIYHNLEETPLPFADGAFDLVWCSHILEHITNLVPLKMELTRILRPEGKLVAVVPDYQSPDAWGDPTHVRGFSYHAFKELYWQGFYGNTIGMLEVEMDKNWHWKGDITTMQWLWAVMTRRGE